jgi:hypothetical protein
MTTEPICVRVPRGRRKMDYFLSALGRKPEFLYSFRFGGNFVYVTADEYERVKLYATRARVDFDKLLKCWG